MTGREVVQGHIMCHVQVKISLLLKLHIYVLLEVVSFRAVQTQFQQCLEMLCFLELTVDFNVDKRFLVYHLQLIPLFIFIGGGAAMSMLYLARLGLRNPDVW